MDSIRERVRQAMEWLKDNKLFNSNRAIAEKMGYNPSVVSQVITGKSNVSERFVKSLCGVYPPLSIEYETMQLDKTLLHRTASYRGSLDFG